MLIKNNHVILDSDVDFQTEAHTIVEKTYPASLISTKCTSWM